MVRILPVKQIAERKRLLLAQSELHRRTFQLQYALLLDSAATLKKRFAILGASSMALSLGASVVGLLAAKKRSGEKSDVLGKILSGVSLFGQIKGFFKRMKGHADGQE